MLARPDDTAAAHDASVLEANWRVQAAEGANVLLLDGAALKQRFPSLNTDDIAVGAFSPDDGFLDPHSALQGFRRKAVSLGITYLQDRVVGLDADRGRVTAVTLASGGRIACDYAVNVANCWAPEVCAMVGMTDDKTDFLVPQRMQVARHFRTHFLVVGINSAIAIVFVGRRDAHKRRFQLVQQPDDARHVG